MSDTVGDAFKQYLEEHPCDPNGPRQSLMWDAFEGGWMARDELGAKNLRDRVQIYAELEKIEEKIEKGRKIMTNLVQDEREGKCWSVAEAELYEETEKKMIDLEAVRRALLWVLNKTTILI